MRPIIDLKLSLDGHKKLPQEYFIFLLDKFEVLILNTRIFLTIFHHYKYK